MSARPRCVRGGPRSLGPSPRAGIRHRGRARCRPAPWHAADPTPPAAKGSRRSQRPDPATPTLANLGHGVLLGALPLLTAQVTRDPLAVSGVTAFTWLPWLLFSLPV